MNAAAEPAAVRTNEQIQAGLLARSLAMKADRLARLVERLQIHAQRVETRAVSCSGVTYASLVADVQADVWNSVNNLQLAELTAMAAEADEYRLKGE